MITLKTEEQIKRIEEACRLTARLMRRLESFMEPGMSTWEVDKFCYDFIKANNGVPAFLNYAGFPASACISINEEVIHGIPSKKRIIHVGDLVDIDLGINLDGHFSDMARTFIIGETTEEKKQLNTVTEECLRLGIEAAAQKGARIQDIGKAVYKHANAHKYGVVRDYCGHGVGLAVHEEPEIPNYASPYMPNPRIREGMVLAIEPMINLGTAKVRVLKDNWTVVTSDGLPSSHFEDTVAITNDGLRVLTV
ncbi:MAG TPA: type I methionyl aminopeptidase [Sphaerochaeta sp.]|jgi:methionyl aminopeptidase|nr:type I methionyl aminopeptidase [Spirochaetota bacterium]NLV61499.1 type I methionyl aminopeptidase [Spirochaetales bacterium]HOE83849.1 type I methionyl aminopeptidase [Sphaerochaeta sp.]HOQ94316.1 type I methionyl aminopeptidase [Sphaerochaeta sp.]HPK46752.1 type I methionyl aminopeptidase [Sphaerochaeta sp.]